MRPGRSRANPDSSGFGAAPPPLLRWPCRAGWVRLGRGLGDPLAVGVGEGEWDGERDGDPDGDGDGEGDGERDGERDGVRDGDGEGEPVADGLPVGRLGSDTDGVGNVTAPAWPVLPAAANGPASASASPRVAATAIADHRFLLTDLPLGTLS